MPVTSMDPASPAAISSTPALHFSMKCPILVLVYIVYWPVLMLADESTSLGWSSDFETGERDAIEQNLPLLVFFTGSDWCVWCHKLESELFSTETFRNAVGRDFVAVRLDFPRRHRLPVATERQNRLLAKRFGVEAFPTVLWLKSGEDQPFIRHGYLQVDPAGYLRTILP